MPRFDRKATDYFCLRPGRASIRVGQRGARLIERRSAETAPVVSSGRSRSPTRAFPVPAKSGVRSRGEIARLGLEPLADVAGAPLAIGRPSRREAVVHHVVALDAERVPDHLGGAVSVVAVDVRRRLAMRVLLADDLDGILPG